MERAMKRMIAITILTASTVVTALWLSRCAMIECQQQVLTNAVIDRMPRLPQFGEPTVAGE
jgi:hypothetical protein